MHGHVFFIVRLTNDNGCNFSNFMLHKMHLYPLLIWWKILSGLLELMVMATQCAFPKLDMKLTKKSHSMCMFGLVATIATSKNHKLL